MHKPTCVRYFNIYVTNCHIKFKPTQEKEKTAKPQNATIILPQHLLTKNLHKKYTSTHHTMTDELAPDVPLPPAVALPARDPLLPLDTNVARNTIPPHSVPIKHPISFHAFREITNFIRDNGDDWEEFYTNKYTTTTTDKTIGKI